MKISNAMKTRTYGETYEGGTDYGEDANTVSGALSNAKYWIEMAERINPKDTRLTKLADRVEKYEIEYSTANLNTNEKG